MIKIRSLKSILVASALLIAIGFLFGPFFVSERHLPLFVPADSVVGTSILRLGIDEDTSACLHRPYVEGDRFIREGTILLELLGKSGNELDISFNSHYLKLDGNSARKETSIRQFMLGGSPNARCIQSSANSTISIIVTSVKKSGRKTEFELNLIVE